MNVKKVSIITVVYNRENSIRGAIQSVISQNYQAIEYIIIDGNSNDATVSIIKEYADKIYIFLSEPDNGIYDALNKGIKHASGEVIAMLHSDDRFYDDYVVADMMQKMATAKAEFCFANMVIINNSSKKISRYYMAGYFRKWLFRTGWMPPHPTCFINKSLFTEFGLYSTKYKIASDFDFLLRIFYKRHIKWAHLNRICIKMYSGGISNSGFKSKKLIAQEIKSALKDNNVGALFIFSFVRYFIRLLELLIKPKIKI